MIRRTVLVALASLAPLVLTTPAFAADPPSAASTLPPVRFQTTPSDCAAIRIPNDSAFRWHGAFDSHAADGAMNQGYATAEPSPDDRSIYLRAQALSNSGNDAWSWAAGSTGFLVPMRNDTGSVASVDSSLLYRAEGEARIMVGRITAGNVFGVEVGGSASGRAEMMVRGFAQLIGSPTIEGDKPTHEVVVDKTDVDFGRGAMSSAEKKLLDRKVSKLPRLALAPGEERDGRFYVRGNLDAQAKTGSLGSAASLVSWDLEEDPQELETTSLELRAVAPLHFAPGHPYCVGPGTDNRSGDSAVSDNGRYVAFASEAGNLIHGDDSDSDVFVRDTVAGTTTMVSVSSAEEPGNNHSGSPSGGWTVDMSADGRYVVFSSWATNLVSGDTNGGTDVFVRDTAAGTTSRVSVSSSEAQANGWSGGPSISPDGRFVTFVSTATNLVSGDTNGVEDVFVRDLLNGTTIRASVGASGAQANGTSYDASISSDGRYVAFTSNASNLVSGDTRMCPSSFGDYNCVDVFRRDTVLNTTVKVSVSSTGAQGFTDATDYPPAMSGDGRYVTFVSDSANLVPNDNNGHRDMFVRDVTNGTTSLVTVNSNGQQANSYVYHGPAISPDGRYIAFSNRAWNLHSETYGEDSNDASDVFVRDTVTGVTTRASSDSNGEAGWQESFFPDISADGRYVSFTSDASNLVPNDDNYEADVFLRDRTTGTTTLVSRI